MANTLSNMIPDAYAALDVVSREITGGILSVQRDSRADRVAKNQSLRIPVTPANAAADDITPAMAFPTAAYQTVSTVALTIDKSRFAPFSWEADEEYSMNQGPGVLTIRQAQIAQAIRTLVNEMETDIMVAGAAGASRGYGAAATAPFATAGSWVDLAQTRKILVDNGAPMNDLQLVLNTTAGANLRGLQSQVQMTNDEQALKQGVIDNRLGFQIRESAFVVDHTTVAASSARFASTGFAKGIKTITLDSNGTGAIVAGDIITTARDARKYVVVTGDADVSGGGTVVIQAPGLMQVMTAATDAITQTASYSANLAFARSAILFATRLPATPAAGDLAMDRTVITDPRTGLSFELVAYPGLDMVTYRVRACWGVEVIKPEHVAILIS